MTRTGWRIAPGPSAEVHREGFATTALKCGVGSDSDCVSLDVAPTSGYTSRAIHITAQTTYVFRVAGSNGSYHYGAVRVGHLGTDQDGDALMIFDWAYQLQADNRNLSPADS